MLTLGLLFYIFLQSFCLSVSGSGLYPQSYTGHYVQHSLWQLLVFSIAPLGPWHLATVNKYLWLEPNCNNVHHNRIYLTVPRMTYRYFIKQFLLDAKVSKKDIMWTAKLKPSVYSFPIRQKPWHNPGKADVVHRIQGTSVALRGGLLR